MFLRAVDKPAPALLAKRMNEAPSDGLDKYLVAGIEALGRHDPQGKLTGIEWTAGERFLAKVDCLPALEEYQRKAGFLRCRQRPQRS
jgi:hypothetical protein